MRKRTIIVSVGAGALVVILFALLVKALMIPTGIITQGCIITIKLQIEEYEKDHGELPDNLDGFRNFNKNRDITKDEWGRRIIYNVDSQDSITLKSLGRDGKPGGKGKNCDIILRFKTGDPVVMPFTAKQE